MPNKPTPIKLLLFALGPLVVVGALVGAGYFAGRAVALRPFQNAIDGNAKARTLGRLATGDARASFALAYEDPAAAARDMDAFSWVPPQSPAPFVGDIAEPGAHDNARINAQGFRWDRDVEMPKPPGTYRIFLTGGSTAYGSGAPSQERTIAGYLAENLEKELGGTAGRRFEVITAANPAWATTQERILTESRLSELAPDLVIALSGGNDVHWARQGRDVLWMETYAGRFFGDLIRDAHGAVGAPPPARVEVVAPEPIECSTVAARLMKNARLSAFALLPTGARYLFALQPTLAVTGKALSARERALLDRQVLGKGSREYFAECYGAIRARLTDSARLGSLSFLDLSVLFDGEPETEEIFLDSYHFGDRGNARIARALLVGIRDWVGAP